jgi:CRP/FNR family cyclic AMP-dependent transcriptional regulator
VTTALHSSLSRNESPESERPLGLASHVTTPTESFRLQWNSGPQQVITLMHMASTKSTVDHLRNIALFSECSSKELSLVVKSSTERVLKAGTVIMDQGQTGREAYVILEGSATVKRNGKKVATVKSGAVIGELSLLDQGPRTAAVIADTDVRLLVISERALKGAIDNIPAISRKLLKALATRVRELDRAHFG